MNLGISPNEKLWPTAAYSLIRVVSENFSSRVYTNSDKQASLRDLMSPVMLTKGTTHRHRTAFK